MHTRTLLHVLQVLKIKSLITTKTFPFLNSGGVPTNTFTFFMFLCVFLFDEVYYFFCTIFWPLFNSDFLRENRVKKCNNYSYAKIETIVCCYHDHLIECLDMKTLIRQNLSHQNASIKL